jgi:hypothetical protein
MPGRKKDIGKKWSTKQYTENNRAARFVETFIVITFSLLNIMKTIGHSYSSMLKYFRIKSQTHHTWLQIEIPLI